jgi:hypothetical protein
MCFFTLLFVSSAIITVTSFSSDVIQRRRPSDNLIAMLINDEGRNKFRLITPGDINKLFRPGSAERTGKNNDSEDDEENEGETDDEDDDDEENEDEVNNIQISSSRPPATVASAAPTVMTAAEPTVPPKPIKSKEELEYERDMIFFRKLSLMEAGYMEGKMPDFMKVGGTPVVEKKKPVVRKKRGMQADYDYLELDRVINQDEFREIRSTLSLAEAPGLVDGPTRITKYDPKNDDPNQRMKFGLYRRANGLDDKGTRITPGGKKLRSYRGNSNKDDTKESFYDSIRNLGESARAEAGTAQGVLDPPSSRSNKKKNVNALPGKGKKSVITPSAIEDLFKPKSESTDENSKESTSLGAQIMDFSFGRNKQRKGSKETPQWLKEAEQEMKKSRQSYTQRRNKNKKGNKQLRALTSDWRFWAVTIASVGFITAFINVYQTTGGFVGSGQGPELII